MSAFDRTTKYGGRNDKPFDFVTVYVNLGALGVPFEGVAASAGVRRMLGAVSQSSGPQLTATLAKLLLPGRDGGGSEFRWRAAEFPAGPLVHGLGGGISRRRSGWRQKPKALRAPIRLG